MSHEAVLLLESDIKVHTSKGLQPNKRYESIGSIKNQRHPYSSIVWGITRHKESIESIPNGSYCYCGIAPSGVKQLGSMPCGPLSVPFPPVAKHSRLAPVMDNLRWHHKLTFSIPKLSHRRSHHACPPIMAPLPVWCGIVDTTFPSKWISKCFHFGADQCPHHNLHERARVTPSAFSRLDFAHL